MESRYFFCAILLLVVVGCATSGKPQRIATIDDPFAMPIPQFMLEKSKLLNSLEQGYPRDLNEQEWGRMRRIDENIDALVGEATSLGELDRETRYTLFTLRNQLVAVALGGEAADVVCVRMQTTGTRLTPRRRCMSRAELEEKEFNSAYIMQFIEMQLDPLDPSVFFSNSWDN